MGRLRRRGHASTGWLRALAAACCLLLAVNVCSATTITSATVGAILDGAPDADWWYGCSPTSAGMLMGYYDRNGYAGASYDNLVPGGVAELNTFGSGPYLLNDVIASSGHINDFYRDGYLADGDDLPSTEWHTFDCLADFMGTSQDAYGNANGSTTFWNYSGGARLTTDDLHDLGSSYYDSSGLYGLLEYVEYAGYEGSGYNQYVDAYVDNGSGFTWEDYKAEIDAGRPLLIMVEGHTMLGFGYDETDGAQTVDLYDTWGLGVDTMDWGGSYSGLPMLGVTTFTLTGGAVGTPEPGVTCLALLSACVAAYVRRRRKSPADRSAA